MASFSPTTALQPRRPLSAKSGRRAIRKFFINRDVGKADVFATDSMNDVSDSYIQEETYVIN